MTNELRVLADSEWTAWWTTLDWAFGGLPESQEEQKLWRDLTDFGRSYGVWDAGQPVGTLGTLTMAVSVPGGAVLPVAGVTMVSVAATHRRQGILRTMMRRALETYRESGEPLAALTASEPAIYGRFGYGAASQRLSADIDIHRVTLGLPPGADNITLRVVDPADEAERCEALYARLVPTRPGMLARGPGWERLPLLDPRQDRAGASARRCVLAERDGELLGYARYALKPEWEPAGPRGTVLVRDLDAAEPAAYGALLRYLHGIDLMSTLTLDNRPVDDPFLHMVSDVRRARLRVTDRLYLRPVDLGAALAGRTYATDVDVVLEVSDGFCPWNEGRWRLSGGPGGAVCERTADAADLALPVAALGAAYLGGTSLRSLAAAGRVEELRTGALGAAATAFGSTVAPWLPHGF
ncbi:GNAT family N-acetyltransferase [Streptomyces johnsoniae]|uniref:GNAT family N-acetyltransferase n=1 Tax=Streptomyces johnsoniae TaxID=3075532 RepID=A0ABU2SCS1_9ACTN|nr:GNAT family N-acetyltransferase [Streptomyces sp. DSM 41886]MDT0446772.1 GNAT family N-acetyltransferase [Streptomyces sp. DSM 41886]